MNNEQLNFISNDIKGLQCGDKKIRLFEYLKSSIHFNGFVFYKKHSPQSIEQNGLMNLRVSLLFLTVELIHVVLH